MTSEVLPWGSSDASWACTSTDDIVLKMTMSCVHKCRLHPMIEGCKAVIKSVMAKLFHELSTMVMEMPMGHRRSCRLTYHFRVFLFHICHCHSNLLLYISQPWFAHGHHGHVTFYIRAHTCQILILQPWFWYCPWGIGDHVAWHIILKLNLS